ncbi:hypothetical protein H0H93_005639 [Arthromyces matolae]|nr:hypothetical protein H0H93_005639 [Arthromyces matolae]
MASPHTAGLLAYLLSIYPSKEFNPTFENEKLVSLTQPQESALPSSVYAVLQAALPDWMASFLPSVVEAATAPVPPSPKTLTPAQLKQGLLALGTSGIFSDLPTGSPNLLIFNNATA